MQHAFGTPTSARPLDVPDHVAVALDTVFGAAHLPTRPITDVVVVHKGEPVPSGYAKVRALHCRTEGSCCWLVRMKRLARAAQIEFTIEGAFDADLNKSAGGKHVFLCVARGDGAPVTSLAVVFTAERDESLPPGAAPACPHCHCVCR